MGTVAALARRGVEATLLMPRGPDDPALTAAELCGLFRVEGEFRLVQRESRWAGEALVRTLFWLRQVFRDPEIRRARPALFAHPGDARHGRPCALARSRSTITGPGPTICRSIRPLLRRTARQAKCLGIVLHSAFAAGAYERAGVPAEKMLVAHNGAEPRRMGPPPDKAAARAQLGLDPDRFTAALCGAGECARRGWTSCSHWRTLRPDTLFLLVGSEGEGPVEAEARRRANVRIVPWQAPAELPAWLARRGRAADPAVARAARAVQQLRAAAEALRLSRRRPADPRARRARHGGVAARRRECPARPARRSRRPRRRRSTGCATRRLPPRLGAARLCALARS